MRHSDGMTPRIRELVERVWGYHQLGHPVSKADAILVLCSHDTAVAERGAELFLDGWAPLLIFSGGLGTITRHLWTDPEADQFAAIAEGMGVPRANILIENRSTNTGENVLFTKQLLADRGLDPQSFILVQKPYMERRSFATFMKLWPEKRAIVTSPQVTLDEYLEKYSNDRSVKRRGREHHGRGSAAREVVRGYGIPDSSGNPRGRLGRVRGFGCGGVRHAPRPRVTQRGWGPRARKAPAARARRAVAARERAGVGPRER